MPMPLKPSSCLLYTSPDVRNLIEAILLGLDGSPVTSLSGLPLTHVALGLNVGETRNGTVGATEVGAVDNNLVTGEDAHRMAVLLVLLNEVAERDVITRGILDAGQNALGTELGKELPRELGVDTHGDVIGCLLYTSGAAQHQLALIEEREQRGLRDALPDALAVFCDLRERYPDLSLRDLGEMADPPLSKSALYHRVLRLEKLIEANR